MTDADRSARDGSTDDGPEPTMEPLLIAASAGRLPHWAEVSPRRLRHAARVAGLMEEWALELGLDALERRRWRAAAWLHDALRDASPEQLRAELDGEWRALPGPLLHGPAAAERLRSDGVGDREILGAVARHTTGHPELREAGRALYIADFLEPGRTVAPAWRAGLLARMPGDRDRILPRVVEARIRHLLDRGSAIHAETISFWNSLPHRS